MAQNFAERLRGFRQEKNLTQQELADALGVSNKTVSRWETDGGYPDVGLLVPLARALGTTVDELLDDRRPVRRLGRTDWQNLLSFAFALGGGVLFFLLDLFMPTLICYLAYLGCMAYGVYLQRYYTYRGRWFSWGNLVMNAAVNLTACMRGAAQLAGWLLMGGMAAGAMAGDESAIQQVLTLQKFQSNLLWSFAAALLPALALTGVSQYLIWKKGGPDVGLGGFSGKRLRLGWKRPRLLALLPAAAPLLAGGYWFFSYATPPLLKNIEAARPQFALLLLALAVLFTLPLLKRGLRRWILPQWCMTALCWNMTGLLTYAYWMPRKAKYFDGSFWEETASNISVWIIGRGTWGTVLLALALAAAWILLCGLRLRREDKDRPGPLPSAPEGTADSGGTEREPAAE